MIGGSLHEETTSCSWHCGVRRPLYFSGQKPGIEGLLGLLTSYDPGKSVQTCTSVGPSGFQMSKPGIDSMKAYTLQQTKI